jgi:hypothetical protein
LISPCCNQSFSPASKELIEQYTLCFFEALMIFLGDRSDASRVWEYWWVFLSLLIGAYFYGQLLGTITTAIGQSEASEAEYRTKLEYARMPASNQPYEEGTVVCSNPLTLDSAFTFFIDVLPSRPRVRSLCARSMVAQYLAYRRAPRVLRDEIMRYFGFKYPGQRLFNEEEILDSLSFPLRAHVALHNAKEVLKALGVVENKQVSAKKPRLISVARLASRLRPGINQRVSMTERLSGPDDMGSPVLLSKRLDVAIALNLERRTFMPDDVIIIKGESRQG